MTLYVMFILFGMVHRHPSDLESKQFQRRPITASLDTSDLKRRVGKARYMSTGPDLLIPCRESR